MPPNKKTAVAKPKASKDLVVANTPETAPLPWERQTGEPAKAFHAFGVYRDMGAGGTLAAVREEVGRTRVAGPSMVERWSSRWAWVERRDAWLDEQDRQNRIVAERERAQQSRRRAQAAGRLLVLGIRRIEGAAAAEGRPAVEPLNLNDMSAADVIRAIEVGARIQRAEMGEQPFDFEGAVAVNPKAVQTIVRGLVELLLEQAETVARRVVDEPDSKIEAIIEEEQENALAMAQDVWRRGVRG